jgi:phosphate transport system protein
LKINNDLERIADLAVNIAERAARLIVFSDFDIPASLEQMADEAVTMVHAALDGFVKMDGDAARQICSQDAEIDEINVQVIGELCRAMQRDASLVEPALHAFSACRHVERIADHATNIAEDVVYLVQGEIARHKHEDIPPVRGSPMPATP